MNSRREGFALAAAVLAMMVVGAIVTGGFYAASQEGSVARTADAGDLALYVAETGLNASVASQTALSLSSLTRGTENTGSAVNVTYGGTTVGNYQTTITRVSDLLYVVKTVGTVTLSGPYSGSTRTLAAVVRVRTVNFDTKAAVMVYGDLKVGGTSDVVGTDWYYPGWAGCSTNGSSKAVIANPASAITTQGSGKITGGIDKSTTLSAANFTIFGDMTFNEVAALRNHPIAAGATVGPSPTYNTGPPQTCKTTDATNWGAPTTPGNVCSSYYPIIEALGNLRISSNGSGQGILLVRGDLDISGGFDFYGVVVVLGTVKITGTGGHINGTLFAYGQGDIDSNNTALGNALLQYSSCGIQRAVLGNSQLSRASLIANRSWLDVSNIQNGN